MWQWRIRKSGRTFFTEFLVRLNKNVNRNPYPIIPLALNNSHITACSNDYSFRKIFSKTLKAIGDGDCLITLTTSGKSKNIIDVLKLSKKMRINSIGFEKKLKILQMLNCSVIVITLLEYKNHISFLGILF